MKLENVFNKPVNPTKTIDVVTMTKAEAKILLKQITPQIKGCVMGEHPKLERLAKLVGYDLKKVS